MDARKLDREGRTVCPQCGKHYYPVLGERVLWQVPIQREFPNAEPWQREQLVSGICSYKCWDLHLTGKASGKYDERGRRIK